MKSPRLVVIATVALALAPGIARAESASITSRDVPLDGERTLAAAAPSRFDLVGLHWRGPGTVEFRTRSLAGRWSSWRTAAPEDDDRPDAGSAEAGSQPRWQLGNPWWVGPSNGIAYRLRGRVTALRAFFVRSPEVRVPLRHLSSAGSPTIVPRASWGANESIRRAGPSFVSALRFAVVHHTAGSNTYSRAESASIVRAIQLYHVKGNGWNDIGYNALVDRFGTVFEGRYGGLDRNVVGAHALGFNTGSVGVAVLGTYTDTGASQAAEDAVSGFLAWRLDIAHVDPRSTLTYISGGSNRFPRGIPVFLRAVSGHRDTAFTACPGDRLYARLGAIAEATSAIGLPKLYAPEVTGKIGGLVRFRARLSNDLAWSVTISDAAGGQVAQGTGFGKTLDWTWDTALVSRGEYRWRMTSSTSLTPANGTLGASVPPPATAVALAITGAAADPETITPNDDGQTDTTTLTYTTTADATVAVTLLDASGQAITELQAPVRQPAGEHVVTFGGAGLPDGAYTFVITARDAAGTEVTTSVPVLITRTLGAVAVSPATFSPKGDGQDDRLEVSFELAAPAVVKVRVLRGDKWVATPFHGPLAAGVQRILWDGAKRFGQALDGDYTAVVEATDGIGTSAIPVPFVKDTHAPLVRVLRGRPVRLSVSEPARVVVLVNGARRRFELAEAGTVTLAGINRIRTLVAIARDAAGNVSTLRRTNTS